jgi:hypothetical protein
MSRKVVKSVAYLSLIGTTVAGGHH